MKVDFIWTLRFYGKDQLHADTPSQDCPVVHKGNKKSCQEWAKKNGYTWKSDSKLLFGGYWRNKKGECVLPM